MKTIQVDGRAPALPSGTRLSRVVAAYDAAVVLFVFAMTLFVSPDDGCAQSVAYDPYGGVAWESDLRCLAQFHDHATTPLRLQATADADYCFGSYFHYSGNPARDYAWKEFRWPVDDWLGSGVEAGLGDLTLFPNVEQIAPSHWTSPWINGYIEYVPGGQKENQYETPEEGFALARELGALPILAHPWGGQENITGMHAIEIHNGYGLNKHLDGTTIGDLNDKLIPYWDRKLAENPRLFAVAVNDWFGPFSHVTEPELAWAQDTGKQILLVPDKTSESAKNAFRQGAMFALVDKGRIKGSYANIDEIIVSDDSIRIATNGTVRWISNGEEVYSGEALPLSKVTGDYVRAEVGLGSTTIYTQPWTISYSNSTCDFNGDGRCGREDVDALSSGVTSGFDAKFDLNGDARIDTSDLSAWLEQAAEANGFSDSFLVGDSDLDGSVDPSDVNAIGLHWLQKGVWSDGDFNGDGTIDAADLNAVGRNWQQRVPKLAAAAPVPEPDLGWTIAWPLVAILLSRRSKACRVAKCMAARSTDS